MKEHLIIVGMLAGGLGLFMLAVSMISDGLKLAAGRSLRNILGKWTRSPARGIVTGLTITAIVQSSSAVTIAIIGFVNAGLISTRQALGVVYGANIGTTMTGWLIAIAGFKINVESFALPMIGIGMLLRLAGSQSQRAQFGMALVGFGLFFIGIDVLREAFEGFTAAFELRKFTLDGIAGVFLYLGVGFLMTVFTQSSSAAIAVTLTAATGGILGINAAAAMVIGANMGTTSTAAIAVIGATPNAKRVAAAHVIFNVVTGLVALMILPLLFWIVKSTGKVLGLADIPAVTLALFHTTFNVLGVLLMWPLSSRLTRILDSRFVTQEEIEGRPRFLDKTVAVSPTLAVNALTMELSRIIAVVRRMSLAVLSAEFGPGKRLANDFMVVEKLSQAVAKFITRLEQSSLTGEVSDQLARVLRADQHLLACAEQILEAARVESGPVNDEGILKANARFRSEVVGLMELANLEVAGFSIASCEEQLERMQVSYEDAKANLLRAGVKRRIPIEGVINLQEQNSRIRRIARQMFKAVRNLNALFTTAELRVPDTSEVD